LLLIFALTITNKPMEIQKNVKKKTETIINILSIYKIFLFEKEKVLHIILLSK